MRRLTLAYFVFLASVVVAADAGACRPFFNLVNGIHGADKLGHFLLMGTLALLVNVCLGWRRIGVGKVLLGSIIVLAVVAAEECSQVFFKTRTFDLLDLTADYLGILAASKFGCLSKSPLRVECARIPRR